MDDVLGTVRRSLSAQPALPSFSTTAEISGPKASESNPAQPPLDDMHLYSDDPEEADVNFDDTGEGAGVEGDLEMEED